MSLNIIVHDWQHGVADALCRSAAKQYGDKARDIRARYRSSSADDDTSPVTFSEFVRYVLDTVASPQQHGAESAWMPVTELCQPCRVHYEFIGHVETLDTDAQHVMRMTGLADAGYVLPRTHTRAATTLSTQTLLAQLNDTELQRLRQHYYYDFELFGYL